MDSNPWQINAWKPSFLGNAGALAIIDSLGYNLEVGRVAFCA
jgi:hypothetical protein